MADVRLERVYPFASDVVWRALTEPAALQDWLGAEGFLAEVGHRFTVQAPAELGLGDRAECAVLEVSMPRRLVFSWRTGPMQTEVVFEVAPVPGGSRVQLAQTGFDRARASGFAPIMLSAWTERLDHALGGVLADQQPPLPTGIAIKPVLALSGFAVLCVALLLSSGSVDLPGASDPLSTQRPNSSNVGSAVESTPSMSAGLHVPPMERRAADPVSTVATADPTVIVTPELPTPPALQAATVATRVPQGSPPQGVLRYVDDDALTTLNPLFSRTAVDHRAHELVFDPLFYQRPGTTDWTSRIVARFEVSEERDEITVWLLPGVIWHDGRPLVGDDVCFTVAALLRSDTPASANGLAGCEVVADNAAASISLDGAVPDPRALLDFFVLPNHRRDDLISPETVFANRPVGTGSMVALRGVRGVHFTAFPNAHHQPTIESLVLTFVRNPATDLQALMDGEIDGIIELPPDLWADADSEGELRGMSFGPGETQLLLLNTESGALAQAEVRSAVSAAIDVTALTRASELGDLSTPIGTSLPRDLAWSAKRAQAPSLNPGRVSELMLAAGASKSADRWLIDGEPVVLRIAAVGGIRWSERMRETLANDLGRAGFSVQMQPSASRLGDLPDPKILQAQVDILLVTHRLFELSDLASLLHTPKTGALGKDNAFGSSSSGRDHLLQSMLEAKSSSERVRLAGELEDLLTIESPVFFVLRRPRRSVWSTKLTNASIGPRAYFTEFDQWRLAD